MVSNRNADPNSNSTPTPDIDVNTQAWPQNVDMTRQTLVFTVDGQQVKIPARGKKNQFHSWLAWLEPELRPHAYSLMVEGMDCGEAFNAAKSFSEPCYPITQRHQLSPQKPANENENEIEYVFRLSNGSDGYDTQIKYLIKGALPANSFGMVYGASGQFKSFHAVSWACCVASGKNWDGARVEQGSVIYVVGEGGLGAPRRFRGWEVVHNHSEQLQHLYKLDGAIYPTDYTSCQTFVNTVKRIELTTGVPVRLIVLDTLARCFAGGDENRASDMGAFITGCDFIKRKTGATILVVHHTGKDVAAGARGSSSLSAACDFEFAVKRIPDELGFVLKHTKSKDSRELADRAYRLSEHVLFIDDEGDEETTLVSSLIGEEPPEEPEVRELKSDNQKEVIRAVVEALAAKKLPFINYIRDELKGKGLDVKNYRRWLKQLSDSGKITVSSDGLITLLTDEE